MDFFERCRGSFSLGIQANEIRTWCQASRLGGFWRRNSDRLMAARPATVMSLVVRVFKREVRAFGGCLGMHRRWRTWHAAISCGEVWATFDPQISEWGNPISSLNFVRPSGRPKFNDQIIPYWIHRYGEANPGNWNISVPGGKDINRDSVSSGERTRTRPVVWSKSAERLGNVGQSGW